MYLPNLAWREITYILITVRFLQAPLGGIMRGILTVTRVYVTNYIHPAAVVVVSVVKNSAD